MPNKRSLMDLGVPVLLVAGFMAALLGIVHLSGSLPLYWSRATAIDELGWVALCGAVYGLSARYFAPHKKLILILFAAIYIAMGVGPGNLFAVMAFLFSSLLVGHLILRGVTTQEPPCLSATPAMLLGCSFFVMVFGSLIHGNSNSRELYWAIIAIPYLLLFSRQAQQNLLAELRAAATSRFNSLNEASGLYLLIAIILFTTVARYAFFPSISYDDNALHLRMWSELRDTSNYSFDVKSQIWSVAPFTVDLLHAITSLMADSDSRSALDFTIFTLLALALYSLSKHFIANRKDRLLLLSLFCSTPIIANLLVTLQTELFLALVVTAGTCCIYQLRRNDIWAPATGVVSAAALACSIKLPGAVTAAMLLFAFLSHMYFSERPVGIKTNSKAAATLVVIAVVAGFVALHPYVNAWKITHNPVFPLYNGIFKSPYFPLTNFSDPLYQKGFSAGSYINTFFQTSHFFEAKDYTAGFQYLIFLPVALVLALLSRRRALYAPLILVTLGFGIIMFAATQYWRYLFPVVPVASVLIGLILSEPGFGDTLKRYRRLAFFAVIATNLYFLPGVSWFFTTPLQSLYSSAGKQAAMVTFAPAKDIVSYLNHAAPGSKVVFDSATPYGATLNGQPVFPNWYSPLTESKFSALQTPADVSQLVQAEGIQFIAWSLVPAGKQTNRDLIRTYLANYGTPIYQSGFWVLYRVSPSLIDYRKTIEVAPTPAAPAPGTIVVAGESPNAISAFATNGASMARYSVSYTCESGSGYFVAQINWDKSPVYYKLLPCSPGRLDFSEALPIPVGSTKGDIYATSRDTKAIHVHSIRVDLN